MSDDDDTEEMTPPDREEAQAFAADMLPRITRAYATWDGLKEYQTKERKRLREQLGARKASFAEAMEVGHQTTGDQVLKLTVVESRWQELEEAQAELKDVMSALAEQLKAATLKIKDLVNEAKSKQLPLFQTAGVDAGEKE